MLAIHSDHYIALNCIVYMEPILSQYLKEGEAEIKTTTALTVYAPNRDPGFKDQEGHQLFTLKKPTLLVDEDPAWLTPGDLADHRPRLYPACGKPA